jgi:hypothetical protein
MYSWFDKLSTSGKQGVHVNDIAKCAGVDPAKLGAYID